MSAPDMKPSEALRKARDLITPEGAWTRNFLARNSEGQGVLPTKECAVCWCSYGAMERVTGCLYTEEEKYLEQAIDVVYSNEETIASWNDESNRTHAEVLDAFDRAAALAEAEGR